jgi:hypothetical protein
VVILAPAHGSAVVDPVSGAITYTPAANYNGPDSLIYQVCDTTDICDTATVSLTVTSINDLPIVNGDTAVTADGVPVDIDVLVNDTDVDGTLDPTSVTVLSGPSHGAVTVDPVTGVINYVATAGYSGGDSFTYRVCDDQGGCGTATVVISVNGAPLAINDTVGVLSGVATTINVLANDADPDGALDPTSVSIVSGPLHGTASVDPVTGTVRYTSDAGYSGTDEITYRVCDTGTPPLCSTAILTLLVNTPPQAVNDSARTLRGVAVLIVVLANDTDADGLLDPTSVSIVSAPVHGTVTVNPVSGQVSYLPDAAFYGDDVFTYRVCDTGSPSGCANAIVAVHVNAPPVVNDDAAAMTSGSSVTVLVLANDQDPDGSIDPASVAIVAGPANGIVSVDPLTGRITYTPWPWFYGTDSFTYRVCDVDVPVACDTATVHIGLPATGTIDAPAEPRTAVPALTVAALMAGMLALLICLALPRRRRRRE